MGGVSAKDDIVRPIFQASYESPFASGVVGNWGRRSPSSGFVVFRIWDGEPRSNVLAGHLLGATQDCGTPSVHFCIHKGYMTFAVPRQGTDPGWTWRFGEVELRLVSTQRIWFRGDLLDVVTIKSTGKFKTSATYFVYSYEIGLIAFATFGAEDVRPSGNRMPEILRDALVLTSDHGLGGREYCRYWTCGRVPTENMSPQSR